MVIEFVRRKGRADTFEIWIRQSVVYEGWCAIHRTSRTGTATNWVPQKTYHCGCPLRVRTPAIARQKIGELPFDPEIFSSRRTWRNTVIFREEQ